MCGGIADAELSAGASTGPLEENRHNDKGCVVVRICGRVISRERALPET